MVHRKSEYQNEFNKSSIAKKHQPTYIENLTFRNNRRDREFLHTPFCWTEHSEEDESSDNDECTKVKAKNKEAEPQYQSLAEILAESSRKNEAFRQKKVLQDTDIDIARISLDSTEKENAQPGNTLPPSPTFDEALEANKDGKEKSAILKSKVLDDILSDCDIEKEKKLIEKQSQSLALNMKKQGSSKELTKRHAPKLMKASGKPRRPDRQGKIPGTNHRPQSAISSSFNKPPFLSYGVGDKEDTLAVHRTHNVRSSADVYAQALKAQRLREAEKRQRQKEKHRALHRTKALMDKLAAATPRDDLTWQSEYRKQFHGYEPELYERATSARAVIPRSTPISAVHRGGCLIVHVD